MALSVLPQNIMNNIHIEILLVKYNLQDLFQCERNIRRILTYFPNILLEFDINMELFYSQFIIDI